MRQRWLVLTGAIGVVSAGAGAALIQAGAPHPDFGWTAYSPLSSDTYVVTTQSLAGRTAGEVLLALGAGTVGAAFTAALLQHRGTRPARARRPRAAERSDREPDPRDR